jgi:hypothetical protein
MYNSPHDKAGGYDGAPLFHTIPHSDVNEM